MNENILEVKNLTKIYSSSKRGVSDLSFSVKKGDFHAFIGENGAGKTTTIKTIIGAYTNFKGEIFINNISTLKPEAKAILGYVPESTLFPKELSTFEYLYSLALLTNISKKEAKEKINSLLKKFNIEDLANQKPFNFSSGQKKKVLLIQALIHDPKLIILDEPAANLDPTARYELFSILNELKANGTTIIISSHILSEIDRYTDSLTLIHQGKLIYSGPKLKHLEDIFYEKIIKD
ncbi:ABC transporter ATP-binding protein [Mycoplasma struthionis]|uniref:ABC transporter ATP-binding protein n=1 Tax=Mycoplasma struthionis TaxID=538220 RepID=A0A502M9E8_9MOLU|nr:ABC transporter ATP-binding protein [Mycoplasma struthionis]TPI02391.1 ABC transporter ATP-binding protein [Mycoplasma struthionis]